MQGPFQWVRQTVSSFIQGAQTVIATAGEVASGVRSFFQAERFRIRLSNLLIQSWQGALKVLEPVAFPPLAYLTHPKTCSVWWKGETTAAWRLGKVLTIQYGVPYAARTLREVARPYVGPVATVTDNPWVEFSIATAWSALSSLYLVRNAVNGFADNATYNMAMAKISVVESEPVKTLAMQDKDKPQLRHPLSEPCGKGDHEQKITLASAYSPLYYWATWLTVDMFAAWAAEKTPFGIGSYLVLPLRMIFAGRALLEYPLAAAGNCMEHRLETLNKNVDYTMGLGLSYLGIYELMKWGVSSATGANSFLVNEALSAMLFLHFNMMINLTRNQPLPGTVVGVDPFYFSRVLGDAFVKSSINFVQWWFEGPQEGDWYQNLKGSMNAKWKHPAAHAVRALLVDENLRDWNKITKRYSSQVYLEHCGNDLIQAVDYVQKIRNSNSYQWVNYFQNWVTFIKTDERKLLSQIMAQELEAPLKEWREYLEAACKQKQKDEKAGKSPTAMPSTVGLWSATGRRNPLQLEVAAPQAPAFVAN
jgi:hypothetical protein